MKPMKLLRQLTILLITWIITIYLLNESKETYLSESQLRELWFSEEVVKNYLNNKVWIVIEEKTTMVNWAYSEFYNQIRVYTSKRQNLEELLKDSSYRDTIRHELLHHFMSTSWREKEILQLLKENMWRLEEVVFREISNSITYKDQSENTRYEEVLCYLAADWQTRNKKIDEILFE